MEHVWTMMTDNHTFIHHLHSNSSVNPLVPTNDGNGNSSILDAFFNKQDSVQTETGLADVIRFLGIIFGSKGLMLFILFVLYWGTQRAMSMVSELVVASSQWLRWSVFSVALFFQFIMLVVMGIFIVRSFMDFVSINKNMLIGVIPVGLLGYTQSVQTMLADGTASVWLLFAGPQEGDYIVTSQPGRSGVILTRTLMSFVVRTMSKDEWVQEVSRKTYLKTFKTWYSQYQQQQNSDIGYTMIRNSNILNDQPIIYHHQR